MWYDMRNQNTQKKNCLYFHLEDVKIDQFNSPSSSDVTTIEDTFYIEWQSKSFSLSWNISLWA